MKILDFYIGRVIASTTFITLAVFVSVSGIIKFVEQMRAIGRGDYDLAHAALYVLYAIPRDVEIFFPMSALIGGLIGIGMLASNSELIVMQAAGLSKLDIIKSVMKTAVLLIIVSMAIGEWLAPSGEAKAREIRAQAISGGSLISAKNGFWAKDGDYFVNIGEVLERGQLKKVQIYGFNEQLKIDSWLSAESATYLKDSWTLTDVKEFIVADEKIIQPLTVAVMLLVALSFIFGPLRSVSMGARIMMGVFTGILFFISNEVLGSLSLVYQLPPILGAMMPSVLFIIAAWYFIKKKAA